MAEKEKSKFTDEELYRKILFYFPLGQWLMAMILFGFTSVNHTILFGLVAIGGLLMLLSHTGWDKTAVRVIGRGLPCLLLVGFLGVAGVITFSSGDTMPERQWQFVQHAMVIVHTMLLVFLPGMAHAAKRERMWDVSVLRIVATLNTILAAVLYLIPSIYERLEVGVDNLYFRLFCVVCMAVTAVTSFLIPPLWRVGKKANK